MQSWSTMKLLDRLRTNVYSTVATVFCHHCFSLGPSQHNFSALRTIRRCNHATQYAQNWPTQYCTYSIYSFVTSILEQGGLPRIHVRVNRKRYPKAVATRLWVGSPVAGVRVLKLGSEDPRPDGEETPPSISSMKYLTRSLATKIRVPLTEGRISPEGRRT